MSADLEPREWIYRGRRAGVKGNAPLLHTWVDHRGEDVAYSTGPKGGVIGGRYTVKASEDSSTAAPSTASYQGLGDVDDEKLALWRFEDSAARTADDARKALAAARKNNGDFGTLTLAELRSQFRRAPYPRQAALLAAVIGYLEGTAR